MFQRPTNISVARRIANLLQKIKKELTPRSTKYGASIFAFNDRVNLEREVAEQLRKRALGLH